MHATSNISFLDSKEDMGYGVVSFQYIRVKVESFAVNHKAACLYNTQCRFIRKVLVTQDPSSEGSVGKSRSDSLIVTVCV